MMNKTMAFFMDVLERTIFQFRAAFNWFGNLSTVSKTSVIFATLMALLMISPPLTLVILFCVGVWGVIYAIITLSSL